AKDSEGFRTVAALERDGSQIEHPEYILADYQLNPDHLAELWYQNGSRLQEDAPGNRKVLFYSTDLGEGKRAILVLEAVGGNLFEGGIAGLKALLKPVLSQLRQLHRLESQEQRLQQLTRELQELSARLASLDPELQNHESVNPEPMDTPHESFTQQESNEVTHYHQIMTRSPKLREIFEVIDRIKNTDLSTLIVGETGTGKELFARAIHFGSNRAKYPLEVVACGSIPLNLLESELFGYRKGAFSGADEARQGIFERASGGTVFLDEVADMPPEMQQKILRVLQEKEIRPIGAAEPVSVNVRVISSTQHDLDDLVRKNRFRADLSYRLNGMVIRVPPLRERREDIPVLLDYFLAEKCEEEDVVKSFRESAYRELCQHTWPGNVQELRNLVTRIFLASSGKHISRKDVLPLIHREPGNLFFAEDLYQDGDRIVLQVPSREGFNDIIAECEKLILVTALRRNRGNKSRVTQQLGIPRQTLYNKIEKHGIEMEDYLEDGGSAGG
ncbi:MAG: sigma-54 dependent transcriptional regulator, partial [Planctomycetota bacterium]